MFDLYSYFIIEATLNGSNVMIRKWLSPCQQVIVVLCYELDKTAIRDRIM